MASRLARWSVGLAAGLLGLAYLVARAQPATTQQAVELEAYVGVLAEQQIARDADGVRQYLKKITPNAQSRQQVADLIDQLGADVFAEREAANRRLAEWPIFPREQVQAAARSGVPEVRLRAQALLAQVSDEPVGPVLLAVLRVIELQRTPGLAGPLLELAPHLHPEYLLEAARDALTATSQPRDLPALREAVRSGSRGRNWIVVEALAAAAEDKALAELHPLLRSDDAMLRLTAARAAVMRRDRAALAVLAELVGDKDARARDQAEQLLVALTGQPAPDDVPEPQRQAAAWRKWLAEHGQTLELKLPLAVSRPELRRTLYCDGYRVLELDAAQRQIFSVNLVYPWGLQGLPNGHRLVAQWSDKKVREYDASGREVWKVEDLPGGPTNVRRLPNGNTLIPCSDSDKVVEVDRAGRTVWQISIAGRPADARRLENGRTLIALHTGNRVVEVDRAGKELWSIPNLRQPCGAQRLPNGHTLVCEPGAGRVAEFDRSGAEIWKHSGFSNCWDAQRLANGNTLVADSRSLQEISRQGNVVWRRDVTNGRICRY